jgi:4,4'-diaponeurosporenoate glycosyltransferase
MQGAREAAGDLLLFLDADTVMARGGLERLRMSLPKRGGLVSVQPYHRMKRVYERLSAVFNIIVLAGSNAFTPLGSRLRPMGAFGPCLLCRRQDYFALGGHERVKGEILENVSLGKVFLDAGFRVRCYGGKGVLSFRMYGDGFRSMVEGFTKSFGIGARSISWLTLLMIVCWVFGGVSLTRHLLQSAVVGDWGISAVWAGLYALYSGQFFWMLFRIGNFSVWPAVLFPVPLLFFVLVFFLSLFKTVFLRKARWKGRLVNTGGGGIPRP